MEEEKLRHIIIDVETFIENHKKGNLDLLDLSKLMQIMKPLYRKKK